MRISAIALTALLIPRLALADEGVDEETGGRASMSASMGDPRTYANQSLLMPGGGYQIGSTLSFLTSDEKSSGQDVHFTDVVLLHPSTRWSLTDDVEFSTSLSLLSKAPASSEDALLQGMDLGLRTGLTARSAAWLRGFGGEMRDGLGKHGGVDGGVEARKFLAEYAAFQGAVGGSYHELFFKDGTAKDVWLGEVLLSGKVLFMAPNSTVGAWLGTDFHIPVAGYPRREFPDRVTGRYLNPQTRVNFRVGGVISAIRDWDLFAEFVVVDRGEADDMSTMLPILEGGFDQNHLIFGVQRRFVDDEPPVMMSAW
jgi:hypothetical protein